MTRMSTTPSASCGHGKWSTSSASVRGCAWPATSWMRKTCTSWTRPSTNEAQKRPEPLAPGTLFPQIGTGSYQCASSHTFYYIILHSLKNYFTSSILKLTIPSYRAQKPSFTSSKFITKEFGLLSQIIDNDSLHILHLSTNKELIASSRYSDILPYKHNEVELSTGNLINASYIHTPFINSLDRKSVV